MTLLNRETQADLGHEEETALQARTSSLLFVGTGLVALLGALFFGLIVSVQYSFPDWFQAIPFYKTRPIHVTLALTWIFFTAIGGIYHYLRQDPKVRVWSPRLSFVHFGILLMAETLILFAYLAGLFGGREYLEYPPLLSVPLFTGWIIFGMICFKSLPRPFTKLPVYYWMWATGILIFIYAFVEAHLWLLPFFGENIIRDITVQWKSLGSLVASWNMFVYGTAICLMYQINKDDALIHGRKSFFLFFLALFNAFFNWGHHTYIVPAAPWVAYIAYGVSMTELIVLYVVIRGWLKSLPNVKKHRYIFPYRFLFASEIWIILNLMLAIAISIPAINLYTHGTHITVAHSMGSTIGINTMILLASAFFICSETRKPLSQKAMASVTWGFYLTNGSLLVFLGCLVAAGTTRGYLTSTQEIQNFQSIQSAIYPFMLALIPSGTLLLIGLVLNIFPLTLMIFNPNKTVDHLKKG